MNELWVTSLVTDADVWVWHKGRPGVWHAKRIKNWWSHPAILKYPNEQFYKGKLEPHGDIVVMHSLI